MQDPTEFRQRFKLYKEGKMPYENGLPKYAEGTPSYDSTMEFLKKYEGFKDTTYLDGNGIPTIGYGFTDSSLVDKGTISRAEADRRLKQEVASREKFLSKMKNWDSLSEGSKTALRSYYYNYPAGFKPTTKFMKAWNAGNYEEAIRQVDAGMYDKKNPGLRKRRLEEQALLKADPFLRPVLTVQPMPIINPAISTAVRLVIPAEQTIPAYDTTVSPYISGKPMLKLQPRVKLPDLVEMMEDFEWLPKMGFKHGKLPRFEDGTGGEFKSELDWSPQSWFSKRVAKPDGSLYDEKEAAILKSHIPEYLQIEQSAKKNGTWLSMPNGAKWKGDPRSWVMMLSLAYKKNYLPQPWYTGQAAWPTSFDYGSGRISTNKLIRAPYYNGLMWFSDNEQYGKTFADYIDSKGKDLRDYIETEKNVKGSNFLSAIPIVGKYRKLQPPKLDTYDYWQNMPYLNTGSDILRINDADIRVIYGGKHEVSVPNQSENYRVDNKKVLTDDVVNWSKELGDDGVYLHNVNDGPVGETDDTGKRLLFLVPIINEFISQPGFTNKIKFIEGNTGDFDINNPYKYAYNFTKQADGLLKAASGKLPVFKNGKSSIHINPANRGKFNATKKRTGKTTEELAHSKNPLTRKRAIFALNARKWHH